MKLALRQKSFDYMILGDLQILDNWLQSSKINQYRTTLLGMRVHCLKESPRASELLYPNRNVVERFCKNISLVHYCITKFGIVKLSFSKRAHWLFGFKVIRILKELLEVSQLITNHYYLKCIKMLIVNEWSSGLDAYSLVIFKLCESRVSKNRLSKGEKTIVQQYLTKEHMRKGSIKKDILNDWS